MEFCFAKWMLVVKEHAVEKSPSNQDLISELFYCIRELTGSMPKSGQNVWVSKEIVSSLLNRKESIPKDIRKGLTNYSINELYKAIARFFGQYLAKCEICSAAAQMLACYKTSKNCETETLHRIETMNDDYKLVCLLVESAKIENKLFGIKRNIYSKGNNAINYIFGDIISMSLSSKPSSKRAIFVIPVDADFHFHVTQSGEVPPCVSPNTIHGKWINKLKTFGVKETQIMNAIGPCPNGKIGDIRTFEFNGSLFFLLACSKFDENNVAHSSGEEIKTALKKLLRYHDSFGQGDEMYIPLIGTGNSRAKLSMKQSFDLIRRTILENEQWHNGHISIVLHISAIQKMEEFDDVLQD